jgi:hypothetical protein
MIKRVKQFTYRASLRPVYLHAALITLLLLCMVVRLPSLG